LWPFGEVETSFVTLRISTDIFWQFIVVLIRLYNYPDDDDDDDDDDDGKRDQNMLVIYNMQSV